MLSCLRCIGGKLIDRIAVSAVLLTTCCTRISIGIPTNSKRMHKAVQVMVLDDVDIYYYISPHSVILTTVLGLLFGPVGTFSIFRNISMLSAPSSIFPNTTCFPSRKSAGAVVMKNCNHNESGQGQCVSRDPCGELT